MAWHVWDDEVVVFSAGTGTTHLLSHFAGTILRELLADSRGIALDDLVARIRESADGVDAAQLTAAVTSTLDEFARLDLAELAHP